MDVDTKGIDGLEPNPQNPRTISKHDFESLKRSIKEFGDLSCVVFNIRTGQLVGGHQRINAFKALSGEKKTIITHRFQNPDGTPQPNSVGTVAIGFIDFNNEQYGYREVDWDLDRELAANIAANRIQGEFDLDMLAEVNYMIQQMNPDLLAQTGQTQKEIDRLLDSVGANGDTSDTDKTPPVDDANPAVSQLGEIYKLGRHRLMCGDSTDFGQLSDLMDGAMAELVFTDPPYGVSYQSNMRTESDKFDVIKNDEVFLTDWIDPVLEMSKGWVFIWTSWKVLSKWLDITKSIGAMSNMIIWDKGGGGIGDLEGTYVTDFEVALVFNRGAKLTGDRLGSVWDVGKDAASTYEHPTQKPTGLAETAMRTTTARDAIVLDVFGGSGSTMIAAEKMGRISYTMELDPKYCDVIRKRYARHIDRDDWQEATPIVNKQSIEQFIEVGTLDEPIPIPTA